MGTEHSSLKYLEITPDDGDSEEHGSSQPAFRTAPEERSRKSSELKVQLLLPARPPATPAPPEEPAWAEPAPVPAPAEEEGAGPAVPGPGHRGAAAVPAGRPGQRPPGGGGGRQPGDGGVHRHPGPHGHLPVPDAVPGAALLCAPSGRLGRRGRPSTLCLSCWWLRQHRRGWGWGLRDGRRSRRGEAVLLRFP